MKNELVVKDNALINASYNLEVTEQRLILLAIVNSRKTGLGITADSKLEIHASDYMQQFSVDKHAAYKAMKDAAINLFERKFSYSQKYKSTNKVESVRSRWVSEISYVEELAVLTVTFAPAVVPLITKLEQQFTSYRLKQVANLTSKYAIRLYEILIAWRDISRTPQFEIDEFRRRLGLKETEYVEMNNLKNRVLKPAIDQINKHTDIIIDYTQQKRGRSISGFQFFFKLKESEKLPLDTKTNIKLTEKQISFFANKLAYDDTFASRYAQVGEEYHEVEKRLLSDLKDNKFIAKYSDDLSRVGFKIQKQ